MRVFPSTRINRVVFVLCFGLSVVFYGTWFLQESYIYVTSNNRFEILALGELGFYIKIIFEAWQFMPSIYSMVILAFVLAVHIVCTYLGFAILAPIVAWVSNGR